MTPGRRVEILDGFTACRITRGIVVEYEPGAVERLAVALQNQTVVRFRRTDKSWWTPNRLDDFHGRSRLTIEELDQERETVPGKNGEAVDVTRLRNRSPIARNSDPSTSHEAAAEITASGERDRQAAAVLELLERFPGSTSQELAAESGDALDRYQIARRLPELRELGRVNPGPKRSCRITGRKALTWAPAPNP